MVTPIKNGTVDTDALAQLIESLVDAGIDGLVPCGTSGEFASLNRNEYRQVIETTTDVAPEDLPVITGAGATAVQEAMTHIRSAADAGADAVLLPPPYYQTANDPSGLEQFYRTIADDSPLPIFLYDIPSCTGQQIPVEVITALANHSTVVGLKDSSGDFEHFSAVLRATPGAFDVYQGYDTQLVQSVLQGATGGICGLTNAIPGTFMDIVDAIDASDYERASELQQTRIAPVFKCGLEEGFAPVLKTAAVIEGRLPAQDVKLPLVETSAERTKVIEETLSS